MTETVRALHKLKTDFVMIINDSLLLNIPC